MEDHESCRTPWARAVIRDGRLTLNSWTPVLMTGGPQRAVMEPLAERGIVLADLTGDLLEDGSEELIVTWVPAGSSTEAAARTITAWAEQVGYARVWLPERVLDFGEGLCETGRATVVCPTCTLRWDDESPDFWARVRSVRHYPAVCPACNGSLPEWELVRHEVSAHAEDVRR